MIKPINQYVLPHQKRPFPKGLIYEDKINSFYRLIETKTGKVVGRMVAFPIEYPSFTCYNIKPEDLVLHISSLNIDYNERGKGWGKYFLDFAKNISKKFYDGRLSLTAYNSDKPPHLFYKKQGLVALEDADDALLNEHIRLKMNPTTMKAMDMYLPINGREKAESLESIDFFEDSLFVKIIKWFFK
ncbi:MAG: GNAT family N-acetyltransferase [Cyanobacteria bacterium SIG31]|nr:GNAT family N-acetyltransferase [Cyanobacteria bacterium SIG31]